ncbi:MAG: hypothetical protein AB7T48_02205 [Solirubrobacterales bacterium]
MDDRAVIRRVQALEVPELDASCQRARHAIAAQLGIPPAGRRPRLAGFGAPRLAVALAALCIALGAGALFTPTGHAVTTWIGERLGFGEPGGPPTLRDLRAFANQGSAAEGQPAYVLLRGPAPGIGHYELITYRLKDEPGMLWPANGARCFELNFPEVHALYGASCGLPPALHGLRLEGSGGGTTREGRSFSYASGRVSEDVDAVEFRLDGQSTSVELVEIPEELIERFAIRRPFKFFIAMLDNARRGGTLTVTARAGSGEVVAERHRRLPDLALMESLSLRPRP